MNYMNMNYMNTFIEISKRMGSLWNADNVHFTKYGKIFEACYKTNIHGGYLPGDVILYWDINSNNIWIQLYDADKGLVDIYSEKSDNFLHPNIKEFIDDYPHIENLVPVFKVMIYDKFKDMDKEILGEVLFHEICSENSGSLEEIGEDLVAVLRECKTREQYDLVNNTVIAISGSSLETILNIVKENTDIERE